MVESLLTRPESDLVRWARIPEPSLETAEEYDGLVSNFEESDKAFAHELSNAIPFGYSAFDIGPGPGVQAILLAENRLDIPQIYLIDYNKDMLKRAKKRVEDAGLPLSRFSFIKADMTKLDEIDELVSLTEKFGFSNTAFHELPTRSDLGKTFQALSKVLGPGDQGIFRDLVLPQNAADAKRLRGEVVADEDLDPRGFELFYNSQHAGWSPSVWEREINKTTLRDRSDVMQLSKPNSRYLKLVVRPAA